MEKINFEDIRVGDRIRVTNREEYANGDFDTETTEFTVIDKTPTYAEGTFHSIYNVWSTITLLDRPAPTPTPRVGDNLTPEQIMALPDHAVFLDFTGLPRLVKGHLTVGVNGPSSRGTHNSRGDCYRLVYLPEA